MLSLLPVLSASCTGSSLWTFVAQIRSTFSLLRKLRRNLSTLCQKIGNTAPESKRNYCGAIISVPHKQDASVLVRVQPDKRPVT